MTWAPHRFSPFPDEPAACRLCPFNEEASLHRGRGAARPAQPAQSAEPARAVRGCSGGAPCDHARWSFHAGLVLGGVFGCLVPGALLGLWLLGGMG